MSNSSCPNCKGTMTCSCQKRTSLNGKQCCSKCVTKENADHMKTKRFLP